MTSYSVGDWKAGPDYGPVLKQTDLILNKVQLKLHPILTNTDDSFHVKFKLNVGEPTDGYHPDRPDISVPLLDQRDEPACLPRVNELVIICELTPWTTVVKNPEGVSLWDVFRILVHEYRSNLITAYEWDALPAELQPIVAATGEAQTAFPIYAPPTGEQMPRFKWLRERQVFDTLSSADRLAQSRLGYTAPNVFRIDFIA